MYIETLHLEITRKCTLNCEHCFRGNPEDINMSNQTVKNIFNNIKRIDRLLFTGGEPLIAIEVLEQAIDLIKQNEIEIEEVSIVTNGTIVNSRILKSLKELSIISKLNIKISFDIFHMLEIEKLNLKEQRDINLIILKKCFNATEYGENNQSTLKSLLQKKGNASKLTEERLKEINELSDIKYIFGPFNTWFQPQTYFNNDKLYGAISIDVNGNIVSYGLSFEEEDIEAKANGFNVNNINFKDAINYFIEYLNENKKKRFKA